MDVDFIISFNEIIRQVLFSRLYKFLYLKVKRLPLNLILFATRVGKDPFVGKGVTSLIVKKQE